MVVAKNLCPPEWYADRTSLREWSLSVASQAAFLGLRMDSVIVLMGQSLVGWISE